VLVGGVIVACNVTRNEICSSEILVIDLLALESRWLRTFVVKGKAIPSQAWTGREGFRMLRLPDFKIVGT